MHAAEVIEEAVNLHRRGVAITAIAGQLGVPRRTVNEWTLGRLPAPGHREQRHPPCPAPRRYAYLLGLYLGDGWISRHPRNVFKLRFALDAKYPDIVEEAMEAIRATAPKSRVNKTLRPRNCMEVFAYSRAWPEVFPQHGPGKKHERKIELAAWQEDIVRTHAKELLRGLIHSDGCRAMNTGTNWRHPRYSFSNRSQDILGIFTWACDLIGLRWTKAPHTIYVSRMADVARMDEFIGPKT